MKNFKKTLLLMSLLNLFLFLNQSLQAQELNSLSFDSDKEWSAGRWYLIGRWLSAAEVRWLNGANTQVTWDRKACRRSPFIPRFDARSEKMPGLEILRSGPWFAIEINPVSSQETYDVSVRMPQQEDYCRAKISTKITITGSKDLAKPVLLLRPTGSRYFGKNIDVTILDLKQRSNIQLDLQMGLWRFHLPNRQATGAASTLYLFPVAMAQMEWLFGSGTHWGMTLSLDQSGGSYGGQAKQTLVVSQWGGELFGQFYLNLLHGLQFRFSSGYSQFHSDDGRIVESLNFESLEAHYFTVGLGALLYMTPRWSVGLDGKYGFSNQMAARGVDQSSYQINSHLNYRAVESVGIVGTLGQRAYKSGAGGAESAQTFSLGLRLEL